MFCHCTMTTFVCSTEVTLLCVYLFTRLGFSDYYNYLGQVVVVLMRKIMVFVYQLHSADIHQQYQSKLLSVRVNAIYLDRHGRH